MLLPYRLVQSGDDDDGGGGGGSPVPHQVNCRLKCLARLNRLPLVSIRCRSNSV